MPRALCLTPPSLVWKWSPVRASLKTSQSLANLPTWLKKLGWDKKNFEPIPSTIILGLQNAKNHCGLQIIRTKLLTLTQSPNLIKVLAQ